MLQRSLWPILIAAAFLSGCFSLRQSLQYRPCLLEPDAPFDVIVADPAHHEVVLFWRDPSTGNPFARISRLNAWLEVHADSVVAVTNAGIYEPDLVPAGLYIEQGQTINPINLAEGYGNFYLKPNGVFYVTPDGADIVDASEFHTLEDSIVHAIQSGPLLLSDNRIHPVFTPGSQNCLVRSGIGVAPEGTIYVAIANGGVNFYDFATFFRDTLGAESALYLDGAISTLYAPHLGRTKQPRKRFGAFLVVRHRQ